MQLNIGQRILAGFAVVILLSLGLGWYQLRNLSEMHNIAIDVIETDTEALRLIRTIESNQHEMRKLLERSWAVYFLNQEGLSDDEVEVVQAEWELANDRTNSAIDALLIFADQSSKTGLTVERRRLWEDFKANTAAQKQKLAEIAKSVRAHFQLQSEDNLAQYENHRTILDQLRTEFSTVVERTQELNRAMLTGTEQLIADKHQTSRNTSFIALGLVALAAIVLAIFIFRSIAGPLGQFMTFVERVGQGDLTQKINDLRKDELGRLAGYLNTMVDNLGEISRQTVDATQNLNATTSELQASAQQQVASTSEQSAAIQQITATLDEITQSGGQISERAKAVAMAAESASAASKSGISAVGETVRSMDAIREQAETVAENIVELTEKTQSVGEIIATVNDIAERSNLLALNAAIEASAAGEQGQSFSIVAEEIKNLATQAKDATLQVKSLLGDIQQGISAAVMQTEEAVKRVESGKEQTTETEKTIRNLAESVEESVATFEQIVAATNQQQIGIEQVTRSVQNIREASEQMATGTQELEKTSSNLSALGSQLQQTIARYRV